MANTITFEIDEARAKSFEKLLDEFIETMKRIKDGEPERDREMLKLKAESNLLLSQAREELEKIKKINANREKLIWEQ